MGENKTFTTEIVGTKTLAIASNVRFALNDVISWRARETAPYSQSYYLEILFKGAADYVTVYDRMYREKEQLHELDELMKAFYEKASTEIELC